VEFPKGIEPFELTEGPWAIVPGSGDDKKHLYEVMGTGVAVVRFQSPRKYFGGFAPDPASVDCPVVFNNDHTQAAVNFSVFWSGLGACSHDILFRKVPGGWVAIEIGPTMVS